MTKFKNFVIIFIESEGYEIAKTLEQLAKEIYNEALEDGEPVTEDEALEMAKMELGSKENIRYEKSDKPRKATTKERKVDENKKLLLNCCRVLLEGMKAEIVNVKTETEINFNFDDSEYSLKLIKHRPKK